MAEPHVDRELEGLESALKALLPAGAVLRDQLMFRAGQAAAPRRSWFWPGSTAAMTVVAATLGALLVARPQPETTERVVVVTVKEQISASLSLEPKAPEMSASATPPLVPDAVPTYRHATEYQQLKLQALRWGVENLPAPALPQGGGSGPPPTLENLMSAMTRNL
jgi:hypothetical protein